MKKKKSFLLRIFTTIFAVCVSLGVFTACDSAEIEVLTPEVKYQVGDNVDLFDLFTYVEGQEYEFSYTFEDKTVEVEGQTFFLAKDGEYKIDATAKMGKSKKSASTEITVTDGLATMSVNNADIVVAYEEIMSVRALLGRASIAITIEADYSTFVQSVVIHKSDKESIKYELLEKAPTPGIDESVVYKSTSDGFFNGRVFNFIYECDYTFTIATITTGGTVTETLTVTAVENFAELTPIDGLTFDKASMTASWQAVEGAASYRVKVGNQAKEITQTSLNITELLPDRDFHFFNLAVIPKTAQGEKMGVMIIKDVIINPEGSEGVVIGDGATIDAHTKTVTLIGGESYSNGWQTGVAKLKNSHVAFYGEHGIGTFVEFTFKGNNLPQVCFFADNINGNMTQQGGSGYLIMNGLYTPNKGASTSTTQVVAENRLVVLGPNRLSSIYPYNNYWVAAETSRMFLMSENTLFTQKYLNTDTSGRTYRYVVGSFNSGGMLAFEATLYDAETNQVVVEPTVYMTNVDADDAPKGHIIAYATVKGKGKNTTFTYSKLPYVDNSKSKENSYNLISSEKDGEMTKVTLKGTYPTGGIGWFSGVQKTLKNSYVAFRGNYGVGTYVDFTFKGNNLPQVMLFTDKVNCIMTSGAQTTDGEPKYNGYLLMNGIYGKTSSGTQINHGDRLVCFGPNRMGNNVNYVVSATLLNQMTLSSNAYFTQNFLSGDSSGTTYKYTVGSYVDLNGKVVIDVCIKNASTNALLAFGTYDTGKTKAQIETQGTNIVAYGAVKGENVNNVFAYSQPYSVERDNSVLSSAAYFNTDGTVCLDNRYPTGGIGWFSGVNKTLNNSYVAFSGNYGVGTYVDFTFTGNNLPQVTLFANNVNGNMSQGGESSTAAPVNNGYLLMNGLYGATQSGTRVNHGDKLVCFGPNRMGTNNQNYVVGTAEIGNATVSSNMYFTQNYLSNDVSGTLYKYTVGSYVSGSTVLIDVTISNATTSEVYKQATFDTGKSRAEVEALGGNIIAYGCVKGGTDFTTFKYSAPYVK